MPVPYLSSPSGPFLHEGSQACALPPGSLLVLGADLRGLPPWLLWAPHGERLGRDMKMGSEGWGSEGSEAWVWGVEVHSTGKPD